MKLLSLLLFAALSANVFATIVSPTLSPSQPRLAPDPDFQYTFDNLQSIPEFRKFKMGTVVWQAHSQAVCVYDFATLGGAVGNIPLVSTDLKTPCTLPGKAIVTNAFADVTTAPTSGGLATIALSTGQTAADLMTATAKASFGLGQYLLIPVWATAATWIKLTTANSVVNGVNLNPYQVYATIGTAALTAGHFRVFIDYARGE